MDTLIEQDQTFGSRLAQSRRISISSPHASHASPEANGSECGTTQRLHLALAPGDRSAAGVHRSARPPLPTVQKQNTSQPTDHTAQHTHTNHHQPPQNNGRGEDIAASALRLKNAATTSSLRSSAAAAPAAISLEHNPRMSSMVIVEFALSGMYTPSGPAES